MRYSSISLISLAAFVSVAMLVGTASASQACYIVSNFAVPQYVNLTLNNSFFQMRLNYMGPNNAGITINDTNSYNLTLGQPMQIRSTAGFNYTAEMTNVSWLPVEHSVTINLCSDSKTSASASANATATTSANTVSNSTSTSVPTTTSITATATTTPTTVPTTIAQANVTVQQHASISIWQGFVNWIDGLFGHR